MKDLSTRLDQENRHALRFAEGWLELGLSREASAELAHAPSDLSQGEQGLAIQWRILHETRQWAPCREIALKLTRLNPGSMDYWLWLARATRHAFPDGLKKARELILGIYERFSDPILPFNLACYDAQLGDLHAAEDWLSKAFARAASVDYGTVLRLLKLVQTDPDLAPIQHRNFPGLDRDRSPWTSPGA